MKRTFLGGMLVALMLIMATAPTQAQSTPNNMTINKLVTSQSYEDSQVDTSTAFTFLGGALIASQFVQTTDTVDVIYRIQYNPTSSAKGNSGWTTVFSDSLSGNGTQKEENVLRGVGINLIDTQNGNTGRGVVGWYRSIFIFASSGNAVNGSQKYTHWIYTR